MERKFGLLGEKLGHSFSPQIHSALTDYPYGLYEVAPDALEVWVRENDLAGYNVTIPYKRAVMPFCAELSPAAARIGAVNTVVRRADGTLYGDNTDYDGFAYMLRRAAVEVAGKKAVVLGSGGASKTVQAVLGERGAQVVVISRSGADNYGNLERHADAALLVNTTPVGMYPHNGEAPLDLGVFSAPEAVLDVVYNPAKTALLLQAEARGIRTVNGLPMLVAQAKRASELFTGNAIADAEIERITARIAAQTANIVLIGMPGCGKTTVGRLLAARLSRPFADADAEITKRTGRTPAEILTADGEAAFRRIETAVLRDLAKQSGTVIATGGGAVTRAENRDILRQNGRLLFLERELAALATDDRPLSQNLQSLYDTRLPLYRAFADAAVDGNGAPAVVAQRAEVAFSEGIG